jgi:hypothetical protein
MPTPRHRLPLAAVLVAALTGALLLAPAASAAPASAPGQATVAKKAKACKKRNGETRKHWLKRCRCGKFKSGETRAKFKKRCPGAKVPKRKAPAGGGGQTPPTGPPAGGGAPTAPPAQSDVQKVTAALTGTQLQYFSYSQTSGASDNERYRFCNGTFEYTRNRIAISGIAYDSNGAGTWNITQAAINPDGVSGTATLHYVLSSYQSTDVDPAPPSSGDVSVSFNGDKVNLAGRVYDATKITC